MLFERPLTEAEMSEVAEKYSPRFSSMDISLEAELKKQDIDERLRSAVQSYRDERSMRRWVRGVAAVGLIGLAAIAYIGFKSAGREKEAAEKAREDKAEVERDYKLDMKQRSLHKFDTGFHDNDCYVTGWWLDRLGKHFPDPMTARAAYVDIDAVYAAIQECGGKSDWQTVRKYLYDNGRYDVIFAAEPEEEYADNVIRMDPGAAFDEFVREYIQKAAEKYNARKAAENRPASSEGINLPVGVGKTTFLR
jgi:hypothetical protein